jgi:hypothetical protein
MTCPAILKSTDLAARLGVGTNTLYRWRLEDQRLSSCIIRQTKHSTWWSVQLLQERGFLPTETAKSTPVLNYDFRLVAP